MLNNIFTRVGLVSLIVLSLSACKKDLSVSDSTATELAGPSAANGGATTRNINFGPLLELVNCIGYNIRITLQTVEIRETTVSATGGVHYTRHWRVKGFTATSVGAPTSQNFNVIAGAEMFSVVNPVFLPNGLPDVTVGGAVFIHQGTIVLENVATGERIVARHQVLKNPAQGIFRSGWFVNGQKCN